jgi:hypothetical protein
VSTTRAVEGDASIVRIEAEDLDTVTLGGTARAAGFGGALTNGTGSGFVQGLGITDANAANEGTLTIPRVAGLDEAGAYNAIVHFSNDDIEGTHDYNPQVVDLGLQANEAGAESRAGRTTFRYTYTATNFWEAIMPLDLTTDGGAITFGNTRSTLYIDEGPTSSTSDDRVLPGYAVAPDVDWIAFAPFVLGGDAEEPKLDVTATATTRCAVGKVVVVVTLTNDDEVAVDLSVTSPFGAKTIANLGPGKSVSAAFPTRRASIDSGEVAVAISPTQSAPGAHEVTATYTSTICH